MTIDNKNGAEKLQYDIIRAATKITDLLCKVDKYEYLKGKEILPPQPQKIIEEIIEEAKFTSLPLRQLLEKQAKTI